MWVGIIQTVEGLNGTKRPTLPKQEGIRQQTVLQASSAPLYHLGLQPAGLQTGTASLPLLICRLLAHSAGFVLFL